MSDPRIHVTLVNQLIEKDVPGASRILEGMKEPDVAAILQALPPRIASKILANLQISFAAVCLGNVEASYLEILLPQIEPQLLSAIVMHLPQNERERIAKHVSTKLQAQIRELLDYPDGSIGRIMSSEFLSFRQDVTARDAIARIRAMSKKKRTPLTYAYVVDAENHLVGVLNMRDLMIASPQQPLESITRTDVFSLHCFIDVEEAASELAKRRYFAAPVVDSENHILGIIKAERMIRGVQEDTTKDIQMMFGAGGDERVFSTIWFSLKKRLLWLNVNLATAFMAAAVVALFEGLIAKITVLAIFLPVVAGQGGNAGAQSLAVVMRGIVMREIPKDKRLALIVKEGKLGAVNGTAIGVITAIVAWVWQGNPYLGIVIGLGMLVNLFIAGLAGASIPLLMKSIGIDPAQSSSIILTTVTDIMGFFAFLGFALVFQNFLI